LAEASSAQNSPDLSVPGFEAVSVVIALLAMYLFVFVERKKKR